MLACAEASIPDSDTAAEWVPIGGFFQPAFHAKAQAMVAQMQGSYLAVHVRRTQPFLGPPPPFKPFRDIFPCSRSLTNF